MGSPTQHQRLSTPTRAQLLAAFHHMERVSLALLAVETVLGAVGLWLWCSREHGHDCLVSLWIAGIGFLGMFYPFFYSAVARKKALKDIRPDAQLGQHGRDSLLALVERACRKMGLPHGATQVYLSREKEVNAYALRAEFLPGLRMFNSVQLHRGIVHLLNEEELEAVIAHELGHVWLYSPLLTRCYLVHAAAAATVGLGILSLIPAGQELALMLPFALHWVLGKMLDYPWRSMGRGIEFLCDDAGMQCAGLLPALTTELKMAVEAETRQQLLTVVLKAKLKGVSASLPELMELYEQALPFGQASEAAVETRLRALLKDTQAKEAGLSLSGFIKDLRSGGNESTQQEVAQEELANHALLQSLPQLSWDRGLLSHSQTYTPAAAAELVQQIEAQPEKLLVRLASEVQDQSSTHPSHTRRILYLWRNQASLQGKA